MFYVYSHLYFTLDETGTQLKLNQLRHMCDGVRKLLVRLVKNIIYAIIDFPFSSIHFNFILLSPLVDEYWNVHIWLVIEERVTVLYIDDCLCWLDATLCYLR